MNNYTLIEETLRKLETPGLSPDAIALLTVRLIELRFPNYQVEMVAPNQLHIAKNAEKSHTMYLTNMLAECQREPEERANIVDRYVRVIAPHDEGEGGCSLEKLVTMVRDQRFIGIVDKDVHIAAQHFVADLWLVLARDDEESVTTLSQKNADAIGGDLSALLSRGVDNVLDMLHGLSAEPYENCFTLSSENLFYVSTTLAMDFVWEQMSALVEGDIVLGVPARDTVIFCGSSNTDGIALLRSEVEYVTRNGHHLVTDTLLLRREGKWQVFL